MKINGNEIRPGMVLEHQGKLWRVLKIAHTQPGKGGAYTQAEMKSLEGTKLNERFRSDEKVERARLEQRDMQYLFDEGETLAFMDMTTYEQTSLPKDLLGDQLVWLAENMTVKVEFYGENAVGLEMPQTVKLEVAQADPVVKGQTASSSYKPATLVNGADILVPPYVEAGQLVEIYTADGTFAGRG